MPSWVEQEIKKGGEGAGAFWKGLAWAERGMLKYISSLSTPLSLSLSLFPSLFPPPLSLSLSRLKSLSAVKLSGDSIIKSCLFHKDTTNLSLDHKLNFTTLNIV